MRHLYKMVFPLILYKFIIFRGEIMKKFDISALSVAPLRQGETMKQGIDSAVSLAKAVDNMDLTDLVCRAS